jgi:hypothetical protein|tara:strand:- start:1347 stop:1631 length:285 start_codon:yes stop_codon:yes gene_type:complete
MEEFDALAPGDESMKLLDNGWTIQLFVNEDSKYTAIAIPPGIADSMDGLTEGEELPIIKAKDNWVVEETTPTRALRRLTDSVLFGNEANGKDAT